MVATTYLMPRYRPPELSAAEQAASAQYAFKQKQIVLKRFRKLGFEWGIFAGALFGVIAGGVQMKGWENPLLGWAIATFVLSGIGGVMGYLLYDILFGSQIRTALDADGLGGDFGGGGDGAGSAGGDGSGDGS
jgi:hypothetical protein